MKNPKSLDYLLLSILSLIWASAFFNIKIATYSYGPITIAFFRILLGAIPVVFLCLYNKIKIEHFLRTGYGLHPSEYKSSNTIFLMLMVFKRYKAILLLF